MMPATLDIEKFKRDGYVIVRVLEGEQLARCRAAADEVLSQEHFAKPVMHYLPLLREDTHDPRLQTVLHHPVLLGAIEQLIGGPLIIDNATMFAANPGVVYHQGWHRDVLQIPEQEIDDALFTPAWRHNNLQLNLALADNDSAFWCVPGSHIRPDTAAERARVRQHETHVRGRRRHAGAINLTLRAGEAALYNNNMIHRGCCDFTTPRRTLHFGYHCKKYPPTWHFYTGSLMSFRPEYLATLTPVVRRMLEERIERLKQYPDMQPSFRAGF